MGPDRPARLGRDGRAAAPRPRGTMAAHRGDLRRGRAGGGQPGLPRPVAGPRGGRRRRGGWAPAAAILPAMAVRLAGAGHGQIRATHAKTMEFAAAAAVTARAT